MPLQRGTHLGPSMPTGVLTPGSTVGIRHSSNDREIIVKAFVAVLLLLGGTLWPPALQGQEHLPIIDMHMHAMNVQVLPNGNPVPYPLRCYPGPCEGGPAAATTEEEVLRLTLEAMDRHNIVLGFLSGFDASPDSLTPNLERVRSWVEAAPGRFMALVHESTLARTVPTTGASSTDRVRSWAAHVGHRIQHVAREQRFDRSPAGCPGSKTSADDRLVPEECVLDSRLLMVSCRRLPPSPSDSLHLVDRAITSARPRPASGHPGRLGWRNHDGRAPCTGRIVEGDRVVGRVRGDSRDVGVDGFDQLDACRRVIDRRFRERVSDDHTGVIDAHNGASSTRACRVLHVSPQPIPPRRQSTGQCCR